MTLVTPNKKQVRGHKGQKGHFFSEYLYYIRTYILDSFQTQGDAVATSVDLDDSDADVLMELDNIRGVGDAAIGHLGNVDETVLMDANIDKGAEVGDVGDDAARQEGLSYSVFMGNLAKAGIEINRKVLADLAINNPEAFKAIVEKVK